MSRIKSPYNWPISALHIIIVMFSFYKNLLPNEIGTEISFKPKENLVHTTHKM